MIYKHENQNPANSPLNPNNITAQMNMIFRARVLGRDLATWLKLYLVSLYCGLGDSDEISKRLFKIPMEYGNTFKVFFGDKPTEQLINLLTQYIASLQSLFVAQINNDVNAVNNYAQQVYQIANSVATFLAGINPYWTQNEWAYLFNSFTNMQIKLAITLLTKEYKKGIDIFDRILTLTTIMGDYLSQGLINYLILNHQ